MNKSIRILEAHNRWRRGDVKEEMGSPIEIGIAIDEVLKIAKKYETAMLVLDQIATMPRKTKERRQAMACIKFLESM